MRKIKMFNIEFADDNADVVLPTTMFFDVEDDFDVDTQGAELISDKTGWCVYGFDYEEISSSFDDTGIFAGIPIRDLSDDEQNAFDSIFPERD